MSEETSLDHDQTGPKTSPEPHRRITEPHRRITINILGIFGTSYFCLSSVREITKSSSTFSATIISSNIVWFLQLHDTIQMKSNYTWINYNHDNIDIWSHIMIYDFVWNFIFGTNFISIYLVKVEKRLFFLLSFVHLQRAKDGTHVFDAKYRYVFVA